MDKYRIRVIIQLQYEWVLRNESGEACGCLDAGLTTGLKLEKIVFFFVV